MLGNHRFGIYEKALSPDDSWEARLLKVKNLGLDFFEISIDESDERLNRLYWTDTEKYALRRLSDEIGVPITSMCLSAHRRFPFGSADPRVVERSMDIMNRAIDLSSTLGVRVIQLAGYDVYYERSSPDTVKRYSENLARAAEMAERECIMLANETMDTSFMNSITKHLIYEKEINSPWLKVYPDVGNLTAWGNDVSAELRKGIGSIVQVHLKDTLKVTDTFPGVFRDLKFGEGQVDFAECFRTLEDVGYKGAYLMEMWHKVGEDDVSSIRQAMEHLAKIFNDTVGG